MCGIARTFNLNGEPVSPVLLRKMTDAIAHRGPDGEGFYTDSFIGLGHRRLAIIDLTPAGHQFRSRSDTEVVLYAAQEMPFPEDLPGILGAIPVTDIAEGTVKALTPPHSLSQAIGLMEDHLGMKANVKHLPPQKADMQATWADIGKAARVIHRLKAKGFAR